MKVEIREERKLSFKDCKLGVNDSGDLMVVEKTKEGIESNNFLDVLYEIFGDDSETKYDIAVKRSTVI